MELELTNINYPHTKDRVKLDKLKMKKIKKYVRDIENRLHYALAALAAVVILIGVAIAFSGLTRCK
jgi:hypothetical protein